LFALLGYRGNSEPRWGGSCTSRAPVNENCVALSSRTQHILVKRSKGGPVGDGTRGCQLEVHLRWQPVTDCGVGCTVGGVTSGVLAVVPKEQAAVPWLEAFQACAYRYDRPGALDAGGEREITRQILVLPLPMTKRVRVNTPVPRSFLESFSPAHQYTLRIKECFCVLGRDMSKLQTFIQHVHTVRSGFQRLVCISPLPPPCAEHMLQPECERYTHPPRDLVAPYIRVCRVNACR
jgi:hypothetical protein